MLVTVALQIFNTSRHKYVQDNWLQTKRSRIVVTKTHLYHVFSTDIFNAMRVRKTARVRNRYNQVPHLSKDTKWESKNVHTILRIGIKRALNESAGRLYRAATQHRQNKSDNHVRKTARIRNRYNQEVI